MNPHHTISERFSQGDLARAYDLCLEALRHRPDDLWLRHRAVLCLIRSNALERAEAEYRRFRLSEASHDEDCLALGARLLKAIAFEADGASFSGKARAAAEKYADVFAQTRGHYPGINAATMFMLAGEEARSGALAREVMATCRRPLPADPEAAYYQLASQAEASLLLGETGPAHMALRAAIARDPQNHLAHATTLRQLRLIARLRQYTLPWLDETGPPRPGHFAGHILRLDDTPGALTPREEARLARSLDTAIEREGLGVLYGAIAAGADILIAEAALRRGCELSIVLPVPASVFIEASVKAFGAAWVRRCEACLEAASDLREVTSDRRIVSELNLNFASGVAMGLARIRADVLATSPTQLLVFDGEASGAASGTARDAAVWKKAGLRQCIIPFERTASSRLSEPLPVPAAPAGFTPVMRAMLFLDIRGSSTVPDDLVPCFVDSVLGTLAATAAALDPAPVHLDSWGDGLFLAFKDVEAAAHAAEALRRAFAAIDLDAHELPLTLGLRIAGHFGPVYEGRDPVQKRLAPFGGQVAVASRIERAAVPGSIFVSEPFAAMLAMSDGTAFRCEYVGQTAIDPLLPDMPLYSLRAITPGSAASPDFNLSR